jgi:polyisoprenyl-teichoic acid--peptidoglycan teichoic acid transferase
VAAGWIAVSQLLGVHVDSYALANLRGFADLVDALGGVTINVKERLHGHQALAYVRSRKDSDDYTRMTRQCCVLSALADQLDAPNVARIRATVREALLHPLDATADGKVALAHVSC